MIMLLLSFKKYKNYDLDDKTNASNILETENDVKINKNEKTFWISFILITIIILFFPIYFGIQDYKNLKNLKNSLKSYDFSTQKQIKTNDNLSSEIENQFNTLEKNKIKTLVESTTIILAPNNQEVNVVQMQKLKSTIMKRLEIKGINDAKISIDKSNKVIITLPKQKDLKDLVKYLRDNQEIKLKVVYFK